MGLNIYMYVVTLIKFYSLIINLICGILKRIYILFLFCDRNTLKSLHIYNLLGLKRKSFFKLEKKLYVKIRSLYYGYQYKIVFALVSGFFLYNNKIKMYQQQILSLVY